MSNSYTFGAYQNVI